MWRGQESWGYSAEEKAQSHLINAFMFFMREGKEMEPDSSQWCPMMKQEVVATNQEIGNSI